VETTLALPATLSCMEVTFRRQLLGWVGATHFLLEPIEGEVPGMFAEMRCTDTVRLRSGAAVPSPRRFRRQPRHRGPRRRGPADHRDPARAARSINGQSFLADCGQPSQRFGRSIRAGNKRNRRGLGGPYPAALASAGWRRARGRAAVLTLTREVGEKIVIGDDVVVTVLSVSENGRVRLGIEAPRQIRIDRSEVLERIRRENLEAGETASDARAFAAYAARRANSRSGARTEDGRSAARTEEVAAAR
jgi:carbon storage regulator